MSVVTLPELGAHAANRTGMGLGAGAAAVRIGKDKRGAGKEVEKKYEERVVEGKGRALFLKEGQSLMAGEVVFVDYPSLLIARDSVEVMLPEARHQLN